MLTCIVSLLLIETVVLIPSYRDKVEQLNAERVKSGLDAIAYLRAGVRNLDSSALEPTFFSYPMSFENVNGIAIIDDSGKLVSGISSSELLPLLTTSRYESGVSEFGDQLVLTETIDTGEETLVLAVGLTVADISGQVFAFVLQILGLVGVICLAVGGSMAVIMARFARDLEHQAFHDQLTDLPNRPHIERLTDGLKQQQINFHLIAIDIDGFQTVRERWGIVYSDQFIVQLSKTLKATLNPGWILARYGEDKFALLVEETLDQERLDSLLSGLQSIVSTPVQLENDRVSMTACFGVYNHVEDPEACDSDPADAADLALSRAKELGTNQIVHFEQSLRDQREQHVRVITRLRSALAEEQLSLNYQPQFRAKTRELAGAEALMRWSHPTIGSISPGTFIPLAEQTGIILDYGAWALQQAVEQFAHWADRGIELPQVSVNLSPAQFGDERLVDLVGELMHKHHIGRDTLELEITESAVINSPEHALAKMKTLDEMGIIFAIDDFGTGHSSMANLGSFPFSRLKIDQSFVRRILVSQSDRTIVRNCITLAHELGMDVVAEGVEKEDELKMLVDWDCDIIQGFLFSRPLDTAAMEGMLIQRANDNQGFQRAA
jgi:diguanylate cyclase (GGDEF)-like protein